MTGRHSERGLALVVVLWGIAALSLIAAAMLASSMSRAHIDRNAWTQLQVRTEADTGMQMAILSLFNPGPDGRPPLDGTQRQIALGDTTVSVSIQDELGRIDINYAGRDMLRNLFRSAGASGDNAATLAEQVIAWRSPSGTSSPEGFTARDVAMAGDGYRPRRGPFQSVDELNLVRGMTPQLFRRAESGLTVYSHASSFDTTVAPKLVLEAILGMDQRRADNVIARRPLAIASWGHAYAIISTATRHEARFSRRAVILLSGDPDRPYWILDWK